MKVAGQYVPGTTFLHKMDPRVKLIANISLIVTVFLSRSFILQGTLLLLIMSLFLINNLGIRELFINFRRVLYITIFIFLINLIMLEPLQVDPWTNNGEAKYSWWIFNLTFKSVQETILAGLRIYIMILATSMLIRTTSPTALTKSISDILFPLRIFKFPVDIIAMIMSIALRFIPTLMIEAQRIMKAQSSRGVDFVSGSIKTKSKAIITLVIPLFVSAFSKAEDLSNAMETRGYDPYEKRTTYREYKIKWTDLVSLLFIVLIIIIFALAKAEVFMLPF